LTWVVDVETREPKKQRMAYAIEIKIAIPVNRHSVNLNNEKFKAYPGHVYG